MRKLILPVLFLFSVSAFAQSFGPSSAQLSLVKKGAEAYSNQKWLCAIKNYEKAIDLNAGSVALDGASMATATLNLAKSYEKQGNRKKAANWYEKAKAYNPQNKELIFAHARSLQAANRDGDAIKVFDEYVQKGGDANKARPYMEIINKRAIGSYALKGAEAKSLKLRGDLSCYAPAFNGNSLVFTSPAKKEPQKDKASNCKAYRTDIFQAKQKMNGDFATAEGFCSCVNSKKFNDGPATLNRDNSVIYFTRQIAVKDKDGKKQLRYGIYQVNVACDKNAAPKLLPFVNQESNFGYAAFNQAGNVLYFTSDMPGGFGGMDLYKVSVTDSTFGKPENLGAVINTADDEVAPFLSKEGKLFFASNGHPGIGGLDIFSADADASGKFTRVTNMKEPVNSPYEDFGFVIHPQLGNYFSSNRNGEYDIFKLNANNLTQQSLEFAVTDASTKTALADARVSLVSEVGKKGEVLFTAADGKVLFENVLPGAYSLEAEKSGYTRNVQTIDANTGKTVSPDIKLTPERSLRGKVVNTSTKAAVANAEVQYLSENGKDGLVTHTDAAGLYAFEKTSYANGKIVARAEGFKEFSFASSEFTAKGGTIELASENATPEKPATEIDLNPIEFVFAKHTISKSELPRLEKLGKYLNKNPNVKIEVTGCTDDTGHDKANNELAKKRANQVKKFLAAMGAPDANISTKTAAKLPVDTNCKGNKACMEKSRKENRKVELKLVK